jgi:metal-responsive CopG/Arc/MetJ family transcriptional regulator
MKAIQITIDESLLARLDEDPEVKRDGRSAVFRRAAAEYLRRRRDRSIAEAYRRGYSKAPPTDLAHWVGEGSWPED